MRTPALAYLPGPFDPRRAPLFIGPTCPEPACGAPLVLEDELDDIPEPQRFYDEWVCPVHRETVHRDAPLQNGMSLSSAGASHRLGVAG